MAIVARFIGAEEVLTAFEAKGKPYFSMWCKSSIICQYNGEDMQEALQMIREEIERNVKREMSHECYLKIHPESEKNYTLKSPVFYNIVFKSFDAPDFAMVNNPGALNYALLQKITAIESRLNAREELAGGIDDDDDEDFDDDEEEENDDSEKDKIAGIVSGIQTIIEHPVISGLINRFFPPADGAPEVKPSLGKIDEKDQEKVLSECLQKLFAKGLTLEHLVKISELPKEKIKMLLTLL